MKVGEKVFAIGSPMGLENTISEGIISGKRKQNGVLLLQTTAPISKGRSGGGLFDERGRFVGVTTFKLLGGENLNFAVDADHVSSIMIAWMAANFLRLVAEASDFSPNEMAIINSDALTKWLLNNGSERNEVWDRQDELDSTQANSPARTVVLDKVKKEYVQIIARFLSDKLLVKGTASDVPTPGSMPIRTFDPQLFEKWQYHFHQGYASQRSGNYNDAIDAYSKAIELMPENDTTYINRGYVYGKLGNYNQAIKDFNKAIELNPKDAVAYYNRGNAYGKLGNHQQAIEDYKIGAKLGYKPAQDFLRSKGIDW